MQISAKKTNLLPRQTHIDYYTKKQWMVKHTKLSLKRLKDIQELVATLTSAGCTRINPF